MGGGEAEGVSDVENTIFVAVGKKEKDGKSVVQWALQSFAGRKICLLHVHQPVHSTNLNGKFSAKMRKEQALETRQAFEQQKMQKLLGQYLVILAQAGVQASSMWIEMDAVEKGIMKTIAKHDIRWLVMGAAADKYYSEKMSEMKSKKAIFLCYQAPASCHIWFTCNGYLIYTRAGSVNSNSCYKRTTSLSFPACSTNPKLLQCKLETIKDAGSLEGTSRGSISQLLDYSNRSNNKGDEVSDGETTSEFSDKLQLTVVDAKNLRQKAFEESVRRWKAEEDAKEAICKAEALESSCMKEKREIEEMEEVLARQSQELLRMKNQLDQFKEELTVHQEQKPVLEDRLVECHSAEEELEEKIIQAVKLLITFKEKRDKLQIEHDNAVREINRFGKLAQEDAADFGRLEGFLFSFLEINEATRDFDPSWKIGEGKYGSVYKGFLRHHKVAIKMLPSSGSQGNLEFENEAMFLSRVRHPNLVTLIGVSPESRSLIYEYLENGSLEDQLACQGKTPPLSWQTRTKIASEICRVLAFLHSSRPPIIHGNLKPTNVLLNSNFVSKLSDLGINRLIPRDDNKADVTTVCNKTNREDSAYMDPEFLNNGELTVQSDMYSFGIILLRLLTRRPALSLLNDVKCALEADNFETVLDFSAGEWPLEQAKLLAHLALRCCDKQREDRPDLFPEMLSVIEPMNNLCVSSCLKSKETQKRVPSYFVCPIFQEVMKDPHIAADGFTYEGDAIRGWFNSGHKTSPMTNLKLEHCDLLPNYALCQAIQEWNQQP